MPGKIRDEDIALVRERTSIVDVISEQVTLRSAGGGNVKGLCPFHDEKTPSFNVSPARNVYYCHGCGAGGDALKFVMEVEHLSFVEAVERLAGRAGIQLRYVETPGGGPAPERRPAGQKQRLVAAHAAAVEFYAGQLGAPGARPAREFLAERGFGRDAAQQYGCGFAPDGWDNLTRHLRQRGFTPQELVTAGLSREARSGNLIDRFRRRLLWPIRELSGDVIGFGARKLFDDDDGPKYLNTPETPIYKKSHVLYGIDLAKREIAKQGRAVIVEGYTDVMACHLAGVPTAVATCGTAFGPDHIAVLRRLLLDTDAYAGEIIFTFDGDAAGQKAALRAFEEDQRFVAQTYIAVSPENMDPCELRLARGDTAVRDLIARREPLIAFALRSVMARYDLDTAEGRVAALRATAPLVARIKDRALRPEYTRKLAGDLGMEMDTVQRAVAAAWRPPGAAGPNGAPAGANGSGGQQSGPGGGNGGRAGGGEPGRAGQGGNGGFRPGGGRGGAPAPAQSGPPDVEAAGDSPQRLVEREALKLALQNPQLAGPMFDAVDAVAYGFDTHAVVRSAIGEAGGASQATAGAGWVEAVRDRCADLTAQALVAELAVEPLRLDTEPDPRYVEVTLARLQLPAVTRRIRDLKSKVQRLNPVTAKDEYLALAGELFSLEQHARGLRDRAVGGL